MKRPQSFVEQPQTSIEITIATVRQMFKNSSDGVLLLTADGEEFIYVNEAAMALTGYEKEELLALGPRAVTQPQYRDNLSYQISNVKDKGASTFNHIFLKKNGDRLYIELTNTAFEIDGHCFILTLFRDATEKQKAKRALLQSEEKWRSLVENAPGLIVTVDRDFRITFVNRSVWFEPGEAIGKSIGEFANPDWSGVLEERLKQVFDTGEVLSFESYGAYPNGQKAWYSNQIGPIRFRGEVTGATIITTDITEQVSDRHELKNVESRLNDAQRIAQIGNWEWNLEDQSIWWSENLYRILAREKDDTRPFLFSEFLEKIHPDDRDRVKRSIISSIRGADRFDEEFRFAKPDSGYLSVHSFADVERNAEGRAIMMRGIARDVSERKLMLKELARSEASLSEAQRMANLGSWEWDTETDETVWSAQMYRLLGLDGRSTQANIKHLTEAVHPADRQMVLNKLNLAIKRKEEFNITHRLLDAAGAVLHVQHMLVLYEDDNGKVIRVLGTIQDVTEQKKAEVELNVANKMLLSQTKREQRVRSTALIKGQEDERSRLSRELHDGVGQMLSAVKFSFGMLAKMEGLRDEGKEKIDEIKNLIDLTITEVVRVSNNLMPSVLRDFGLVSALQKIIKIYDEEQIAFTFEPVGMDERLSSEVEVGLFRIAQEAVNNAIKYSNASRIDIVLENVDQQWIILMVCDDGIGFDLKSEEDHGNGILNMKERADFLRGKLSVTSEKGKGTVISAEIPLTNRR